MLSQRQCCKLSETDGNTWLQFNHSQAYLIMICVGCLSVELESMTDLFFFYLTHNMCWRSLFDLLLWLPSLSYLRATLIALRVNAFVNYE